MEMREETTDEGYRLAPFLLRVAAATIDLALAVAGLMLIYAFVFPNASFATLSTALGVENEQNQLVTYQKASGLVSVAEDGSLSNISSSSYDAYENAIKSYYFVFNAADNSVNPHPEAYTIADYNVAVLDLPSDSKNANNSDYFNFATTNGQDDPTKLGVIKSSLYDGDGNLTTTAKSQLLTFFQNKYKLTQDLLLKEDYYRSLTSSLSNNVETMEAVVFFPPFLVFYFVIPMFSPCSRSLGKKWMKLAVIDVSGTPLQKWWLILRFMPLALTAGISIIFDDLVLSTTLSLVVFLVSMGLGSFTKKRRGLHDYCAHSVVVREEDAFPKAAEAGDAQN
jgi:hypothetical protein